LTIIEDTSWAYGFGDFNSAADAVRFEVYKLTLKDMFMSLGHNPLNLKRDYLMKIGEGLDIIENGLYDLINKAAIQQLDLTTILPIFIKAKAYLAAALYIFDKQGDPVDYFNNLGLCRMKINELIQHLG